MISCLPNAAQKSVLAYRQEKPTGKRLRRATAKSDHEVAHKRLKPGGSTTMGSRQIRGEALGKSSDPTPCSRAAKTADRKIDTNLLPMCRQIKESPLVLSVPPHGRLTALRTSI